MRRLRISTKLALAIVPIGLVALAAGALVSWTSLQQADAEQRVSNAGAVASNAVDALLDVSTEQSSAIDVALGRTGVDPDAARSRVDSSVTALANAAQELATTSSGAASGIAAGIVSDSRQVARLLDEARSGDPLSEDTNAVFDEIGRTLISVVSQATFYFDDESRSREGAGATALARASFASFQQERLIARHLGNATDVDDAALAEQLQALETTVTDWLQTADESSPTVTALGLARTQPLEPEELADLEAFPTDRDDLLVESAADIIERVSVSADAAAEEARTEALTVAGIVLAVIVAAGVAAFAIGRSMVKRVRSVTVAARKVAEVDLPKMVDALSNPKGQLVATTPVALEEGGPDEVGELADSFSALHHTLVDVANRQMEILRRGVSEIFVTLARRNRSLVDRQLALIDDLESREEDPEILGGYYKLDHLATRMRRNGESLLVLAGSESPRMWSEPLSMDDVVRAALGEVDEYQRIDVLAVEPARLSGRAVTDLAHLLSELLDNATQFSPPTERVRVTGLFDDDGYVLTIADSGMGIPESRRAELNRLMVEPPVLGLALEPTLGIYVVARLAARHDISVKLVAGVPGTTVRITLPRDIFETGSDPTADGPDATPVEATTATTSEDEGPGDAATTSGEAAETEAPVTPVAGTAYSTDSADSTDSTDSTDAGVVEEPEHPGEEDDGPLEATIPAFAFRSGHDHDGGDHDGHDHDDPHDSIHDPGAEEDVTEGDVTDGDVTDDGGDGDVTDDGETRRHHPAHLDPSAPTAVSEHDPWRAELEEDLQVPDELPFRLGQESEPETDPRPARPIDVPTGSDPSSDVDEARPRDDDFPTHTRHDDSPTQPHPHDSPTQPHPQDSPTQPHPHDSPTQPHPDLPTRTPGTSFSADEEDPSSSARSGRGADGIRDALVGFRIGQDTATNPTGSSEAARHERRGDHDSDDTGSDEG